MNKPSIRQQKTPIEWLLIVLIGLGALATVIVSCLAIVYGPDARHGLWLLINDSASRHWFSRAMWPKRYFFAFGFGGGIAGELLLLWAWRHVRKSKAGGFQVERKANDKTS